MTSVAVLIVSSALGVHWGWQPVAGGGYEYIIRIEPHLVDSLKEGRDIFSDLPPELREVRAYRITVSDTPVPHEDQTPPVAAKASRPELPPDTAPQVVQGEVPRLIEPPVSPATAPGNPTNDPMIQPAGGPMAAMNQSSEKTAVADKSASEAKTGDSSAKPWGVLSTVALGLFASIGLNVFLGWTNRDLRVRYRSLLDKLRSPQAGPAPA